MKRILLIICWMISISVKASCQTVVFDSPKEVYVVDSDGNDTITASRFYRLYAENDKFLLESHIGIEYNYAPKFNDTDTLLLSFGSWMSQGNEMIMKDSLNGYSMNAVRDNNCGLRFDRGLFCTLEKTFYLQEYWNDFKIENQLPDKTLMNFEHSISPKEAIKLKTGCYESTFKICDLMENGRYVYYNKHPKDTLSKGRWTHQGNMLVFWDDGLSEPFYASVEDVRRTIIHGSAMPGAFIASKYDKVLDDSFYYIGYDDSGPSKADMVKPWIGEDFLNAKFMSQFEENRFCEFFFYENEYSIEQIQCFGDVIPVLTLSYGQYLKEGNLLYLIDSFNRSKMTVELSADTSNLTVLSGYCSWVGKTFDFQDKTWHRPEFAYFSDFDEKECPIDDYLSQPPIPMHLGNQYFNMNGFSFELEFVNEDSFIFKTMGVVCLQGKVVRTGNLLILKDNCVEEPFYILISEDSIVPILPGLYGRQKAKVVFE